MEEDRIYLDFNATTPIAPEVAAAMNQALAEPFANPSSETWAGPPARQASKRGRAQLAVFVPTEFSWLRTSWRDAHTRLER